MNQPPAETAPPTLTGNERDILLTLFDLGRKIASVIDLEELIPKIPELVGRLIPFDAFAVYFFKETRNELTIGYSVGYPDHLDALSLSATDGILGRVVTTQQPMVVGDVTADPHYI